ncbi:MAG TPA: YciI family protein [Acetobacteraceae bacterium]|nr:YciI family protein [Acetobacteraceae bacterium]
MKYALLIYEDEQIYGPDKGGPATRELIAKHKEFSAELGGARLGGAGLKATAAATTVRTTGGAKTVHDGPFAETKEQLGGFHLIDVPDLDAAIAVAKRLPMLQDNAIEIRPLLGPGL